MFFQALLLCVGRFTKFSACVFLCSNIFPAVWPREPPSELTVDLLRSCVGEQHAHHLLKVAPGLGCVAVLADAVQHSLEDVVQGGGRLIQQDGGPLQEAVQVTVSPDFLLKVHQLHILFKRQRMRSTQRVLQKKNNTAPKLM